MTSRFDQPPPKRRLEMGLAFVFGCVAIGVVLWLAFRGQTINEQQFEILRIVLALAGGGVGAVIPGFLDVGMKAAPNWRCALAARSRCSWSSISGRRLIGRRHRPGQ